MKLHLYRRPELTILIGIFILLTGKAQASMTVLWANVGGDVVASYSGSLDLTGYSVSVFGSNQTMVRLDAAQNQFWGNVPMSSATHFTNSGTVAHVDSSLDTGGQIVGNFNGTEEAFGFSANSGFASANLYVPPGYTSNGAISGQAEWENTNLTSLFGADNFDAIVFNDGTNTVTFTAVPEPSRALLAVLALGAVLMRRHVR